METNRSTQSRIGYLLLALLAMACDKDGKTTEPTDEDGRILAVQPSTLEAGQRSTVLIAGEKTAFGDSAWLEKAGEKIHGIRESGADSSLAAFFEIPLGAALGAWDVVVKGKPGQLEVRRKDGMTLVASQSSIKALEPSRIDAWGDNAIRISFQGSKLSQGVTAVRFTRGEDTLSVNDVSVKDDTVLTVDASLEKAEEAGQWDLEVVTPSRRYAKAKALEVAAPAGPKEEGRILAVQPATLEAGLRSPVSIVGEKTAFGDSAWLERAGARIPGVKESGGDSSMVAVFDVPVEAGLGAWDLVVQGRTGRPNTRLKQGMAVVPAQAWINLLEPSKMSIWGDNPVKIFITRGRLTEGLTSVRFTRGTDTLPVKNAKVGDNEHLTLDASLEKSESVGFWDLEVVTPSRRFFKSKALEVVEPNPWISSLSPASIEQGMEFVVSIYGGGTSFRSRPAEVWLEKGGDTLRPVTFSNGDPHITSPSNGELTAYFRVPKNAAVGEWKLWVKQKWYTLGPKAFTIVQASDPAVTSVTPAGSHRGQMLEVTISGNRTAFSQGTLTHVLFRLVKGADTVFSSSAQWRDAVTASQAKIDAEFLDAGAPLGPCDVHARYFVPNGGNNGGTPLGNWIELTPLKNGFTILE